MSKPPKRKTSPNIMVDGQPAIVKSIRSGPFNSFEEAGQQYPHVVVDVATDRRLDPPDEE